MLIPTDQVLNVYVLLWHILLLFLLFCLIPYSVALGFSVALCGPKNLRLCKINEMRFYKMK